MLPCFGEGAILIERGELMLQYPINFYPDGHTVDPSGELDQRTVKFTFKGDVLYSVHYRVYNYDTEEVVTSTFTNYSTNQIYNNESVSIDNLIVNPPFTSGGNEKRYVLQCLLTQGESNMLLCDRFVLRGELVDDYDLSDDGTNIKIEDKINLIYEWNVDNQGVHTPVIENENQIFGIIKMQIGSERRTIMSYNYNTGEVVLDYAFYHDYPAGTPYQLYSNYLITQQYFFKTMTTPSFSNLRVRWAGQSGTPVIMNGVEFNADYILNEDNALKYYTITMEKQVGDDVDGQPRHYIKIYETGRTYSSRVTAKFFDDYDYYDENIGFPVGNSNTRRYLFTVNGVLQNGMKISAQIESEAPERIDEDVLYRLNVSQINTNEYHNSVKLTWRIEAGIFGAAGGIRIYRYDMSEDDVIHTRVLLASVYASDEMFIDSTVSPHKTYRYLLVPFWRLGGNVGLACNPLMSDEFTTDLYGYTITELIYDGKSYNGKVGYRIGESWHLRAEIEDSTITQNTDKVLHVGYGKYSSATHTGLNYMSSTFNGSIVQVDCEGEKKWCDDIELVNAWRDFITRDCIYLLRSQKGDVWVVNVVDNPTTTYDEKTITIPTSVSFNWAECASIDDIMVVVGQGW